MEHTIFCRYLKERGRVTVGQKDKKIRKFGRSSSKAYYILTHLK
jgi:hypothetical protein